MLKILLTGTAVSLMLTGAALAQDSGSDKPIGFEPGDRGVFLNDDGAMRGDEEIRTGFMALPTERQDAIRARCVEIREVAKTEDLEGEQDQNQAAETNAVPGVFDQVAACDMVDAM